MNGNQPNTSEAPTTERETPRTDEELVAKLKGQLAAAVETLQELQARDLNITATLASDDCDQWFYRLVVSRTTYL